MPTRTATTDFFQSQQRARNLSLAFALFLLPVVILCAAMIVAAIALVVGAATWLLLFDDQTANAYVAFKHAARFAVLAGGLAAVAILWGSVSKYLELRSGTDALMKRLGAREIVPTRTHVERRLLNTVQEMSIASGVPVPRVFLLDKQVGINALAVGFSSSDASLAVTQGCMNLLTREELQAVLAHEFSHILNGDMRLNMQLISLLHGVVLVDHWGQGLRDVSDGSPLLAYPGVLLCVLGRTGVMISRLVKSACCRQREYLADAAAIQFTRNPSALVDALKKIGGLRHASPIRDAYAEEASHLYFSDGLPDSAWLRAHPPLVKRIGRIDPLFDGTFAETLAVRPTAWESAVAQHPEIKQLARRMRIQDAKVKAPSAIGVLMPGLIAQSVAAPNPEHLRYAGALLSSLPTPLLAAVESPIGAQAVVFGFLMDDDPDTQTRQLEYLSVHVSEAVRQRAQELLADTTHLDEAYRLPLVELALPSLRQLSEAEYTKMRKAVCALCLSDNRMDLFEYALQHLLIRYLDTHFQGPVENAVHSYGIRGLRGSSQQLLSCVAHLGHRQSSDIEKSFRAGVSALRYRGLHLELLPREQCNLQRLDGALKKIAHASLPIKQRVLEACSAVITADRKLTTREAEILRLLAGAMDCPIPPILP